MGKDGAKQFESFLENECSAKGVSKAQLASEMYARLNLKVEVPAGTFKQWCRRKNALRIRIDLFESFLATVGINNIVDYPHLPPAERERLQERKANLDKNTGFGWIRDYRIIDLSYEIRSDPSCGFVNPAETVIVEQRMGESVGVAFLTSVFKNLPTNYGTHIDFPGHLTDLKDMAHAVSGYPIDKFVVEAVVVDVSDCLNHEVFDLLGQNQDHLLPADAFGNGTEGVLKLFNHIKQMEISKSMFLSKCKESLQGKAVIFYTGLAHKWKYSIQSSWRYAYFLNPFLSPDLAQHFVDSDVALIGSDCLQLESPFFNVDPDNDFPNSPIVKKQCEELVAEYSKTLIHRILLKNGIPIVENLRNVQELLPGPILFVAAPLKFGKIVTDNSPARAFALVNKKNNDHLP